MIRFSCVCGASLKAKDSAAGRAAHCPSCGTSIEVPADAQAEALAAASADTPTDATPPLPMARLPLVTLSRLAKAELLRRAQGRCGRCRTQVNPATAQFHRDRSNESQASPGNGDWTVLCRACLERTVSAPAPRP